MKRWVSRCAVGACVAGMVAVAPGAAVADSAGAGQGEAVEWSAAANMNRTLYGPPSMYESPGDEVVQLLYGPPSALDVRAEQDMHVTAKKLSVKASRLAAGKKKFAHAVKVAGAVGDVRFSKIADGSSGRLAVGKSSGSVTVKKGTKKGTYRIRVAVQASGDEQHRPAYGTVTVKVRVK